MIVELFGHRLVVTSAGVSCDACGHRWIGGSLGGFIARDTALRSLREYPLGTACEDVRRLLLAREVMES